MMMLLLGFQYPVNGGLRCQILTSVYQRRDHLTGRAAGKFSTVSNHQNLLPLIGAEFIGRSGPSTAFASIHLARTIFLRPALVSA